MRNACNGSYCGIERVRGKMHTTCDDIQPLADDMHGRCP